MTNNTDPLFFCCGQSAGGIQITFDDAGIPVAVSAPDGGTVPYVDCVLRALSNYCYPSVAGTTQPLVTAHCWIA